MASRRPSRQWRKLAHSGCLRGRAVRYVAAFALCLLAAAGCCLAMLLPLLTFLCVVAAVLLPSALRCHQLNCVDLLVQPENMLLQLVACAPYCCVGLESSYDIGVSWLAVKNTAGKWTLTFEMCACVWSGFLVLFYSVLLYLLSAARLRII
eukprot:s6245_g1.t1